MPSVRPRSFLAPGLGLALTLATAPAARSQDYVREGWYAGARGVFTQIDFDIPGDASNDFGFNVFGGYRMFKGFASDFEFEYVDAIPVDGPPGPNFYVRTFDLAWNFRVYPLAWAFAPSSPLERVQPYLSAGPSLQWVQIQRIPSGDQDDGNFAGRLGGGLDLYLSESIVLTADGIYTLGVGDVNDFRYWSLGWGFAYRFGGGDGASGEEEDEGEGEE
jgi:hypothetical protein